jgi:hypothetical protein
MSSELELILVEQGQPLKPKRWLEKEVSLLQNAIPQMTSAHKWCPRFCGCQARTTCQCSDCMICNCLRQRLQQVQSKFQMNKANIAPVPRMQLGKQLAQCYLLLHRHSE